MIRLSSITKFFSIKRIQNVGSCGVKQINTAAFPLQFQASPTLWAEPLKRKKRVDPAILKAREDRKKRKIEKRIRQLLKLERFLKPVAEFEVPKALLENPEKRKRTIEISPEEEEARILLLKKWANEKAKEVLHDYRLLGRLELSQQNALKELRLESEELYQAAVKVDLNLIPFKYQGPVETPPKEDYPLPDGEYIDISRKWK